jgi:3-deoxy-D-arabino-heptulosonate 7-phosphate (DAHP) synthase
MNPKIKELAISNGIMFESNKQNRNHTVQTQTLEAFAQSIIEECVNMFNDTDAVTGAFIKKVLKDRFGIV